MHVIIALAVLAVVVLGRELVRRRLLPHGQLLAISAATATGYLGAATIAFAYVACHGTVVHERRVVAEVLPGFDAHGKLERGDVLVAIDGTPIVVRGQSLQELVNQRGGAAVMLTIERAGTERSVTVQPTARDGKFLLGIRLGIDQERDTNLGRAAQLATLQPVRQFAAFARELRDSVGGSSEAEVGGPVRIVEEFARAREAGWAIGLKLAIRLASLMLVVMLIADLVRAIRQRRAA